MNSRMSVTTAHELHTLRSTISGSTFSFIFKEIPVCLVQCSTFLQYQEIRHYTNKLQHFQKEKHTFSIVKREKLKKKSFLKSPPLPSRDIYPILVGGKVYYVQLCFFFFRLKSQ